MADKRANIAGDILSNFHDNGDGTWSQEVYGAGGGGGGGGGDASASNQLALNTLTGAVNETAPASDTASSGLNGRLQRIAQRVTALIALIPASLGQKTKAGSFAVTIASDQDALATTVSGVATAANQTTQATLTGAVTETAPANDTASSGLNGRLQRIAQNITSMISSMATAANQTTGNSSLSTIATNTGNGSTSANQTAQSTLFGAVTETAPASDTASSGLNGRLQRIAQRISSLIALVPASLGQKTMTNAFAVSIASDQTAFPVNTTPRKGTGTLTRVQPSADATLLNSNASRITAIFQNVGTVNVWILPGSGTSSATNGILLEIGKSFVDDVTTGGWKVFPASGTGDIRVIEVA